jgi:nicotinamide-nucleotide amidase
MANNTSEVTGSLLTIGDELLLGDIVNGNARHIAYELRARGFRLAKIVTIGDCEQEIVDALCDCVGCSQFLIVTGGLGPTDDDRTCAAVARAFQLPLVTNREYRIWLENRMKSRGLALSHRAARMAELPDGAVKLGMEMAGFFVNHRSIPCYFLPGVPYEMKELLEESVIPDLEKKFPLRVAYLKHLLRIQDLTESELNERVQDLTCERTGVEIGYLPQIGEIWLTLFARAASSEEAWRSIKETEKEIISRVGPRHVSGQNEECLERVAGQMLREKGWKISLAESCTGGLLSRKVTAVAGASDYFDRGFVTYSNRAKVELLGVPAELIEQCGAVSEPVARAMAKGAVTRSDANVAVAITGIAGPTGGTSEKPVGTVFIACVTPEDAAVEKHLFNGNREYIQESAAQAALVLLWRLLSHDSHIHCH